MESVQNAGTVSEDLKAEFLDGFRPLGFREIHEVPLGTNLMYYSGRANPDPDKKRFAIVHKISTIKGTAAMQVMVDQIMFDPTNSLKKGGKIPAGRDEIWVPEDSNFSAIGSKPTRPIKNPRS